MFFGYGCLVFVIAVPYVIECMHHVLPLNGGISVDFNFVGTLT
jgi:hypothetical protein